MSNNGFERHLTSREILRRWEEAHFVLSETQRKTFLARREIRHLCQLSVNSVGKAILRKQKLSEILDLAEKLEKKPQIEAKFRSNSRKAKKGSSSRKSPSTERLMSTNRQRRLGQSSGGYSVPPTTSGGRSGLVHFPGVPETFLGERCSSCGANVASGAAHDCG